MSKTPPPPFESSSLAREPERARALPVAAGSAVGVFHDLADLPPDVQDAVRENVQAARAPNTVKAYDSDWKHFTGWCAPRGLSALPASPTTVAGYVASLDAEGMKLSTIQRRLASLSRAHALAGVAKEKLPTATEEVRLVLAGVARRRGRQPRQKDPITRDDLVKMLDALTDVVRREEYDWRAGRRDRALLLLGFAGAFRSSELAGLNVGDLEFRPEGVVVTVRKSKTDQEGRGFVKAIRLAEDPKLCAVRALRVWIETSPNPPADQPLFRGMTKHGTMRAARMNRESITLVLRRCAERVGIDVKKIASHSLRAGHVTQGYDDGIAEADMMGMTGHKSRAMLQRYDRRKQRDPFKGTSSSILSNPKDKK